LVTPGLSVAGTTARSAEERPEGRPELQARVRREAPNTAQRNGSTAARPITAWPPTLANSSSSTAPCTAGRRIDTLFRQLRFVNNRRKSHVPSKAFQQWIGNHLDESDIVLSVGAIEPLKSAIQVAAHG